MTVPGKGINSHTLYQLSYDGLAQDTTIIHTY
jgi:hypothetical protein